MKVILLAVVLLVGFVMGHMQAVFPYHRWSKFSPYYRKLNKVDWDGLSPLGNEGQFTQPFPCKGQAKGPVQATYAAGSNIHINFTGTAIHDGGHCQFGITYNDKDIVVLKDVFTRCFLDSLEFDIPLPASAPASKNATLVWGWINAQGNREWYMNCIDVEITSSFTEPSAKLRGPRMLIANLPGYVNFPEFVIGGPNIERFSKREIIEI